MFSLSAPSALPSLVPKRPRRGPAGGNMQIVASDRAGLKEFSTLWDTEEGDQRM